MPAFMTIGTYDGGEAVQPGDIRGDASAGSHDGWILLTGFSVEMKQEFLRQQWETWQEPPETPQGVRRSSDAGASADSDAQGHGKGQKKRRKEDKSRSNKLRIQKPTDVASCDLLNWSKAKEQQQRDIQVDCCMTEEDWPYLTMIFIGVVPVEMELDDSPSDSITFTWKKAKIFSWSYDSAHEWMIGAQAEFGADVEESSLTSTAAERGLSSYIPSRPDPHAGSLGARIQLAAPLYNALDGGLPPLENEGQTYNQQRRRLAIDPVGGIQFELESFVGEERLSSLFVFDLELRSTETDIEASKVVGQEVSFRIEDEPGKEDEPREPRHFHGIISSFLHGEMATAARRRYHASVVPTVWHLAHRSDSRVFQSEAYPDVLDIVGKVFSDAGLASPEKGKVTGSHPAQPYCVQYQETDLAFVSRLLEQAGISYFFRHEKGRHTMVLFENSTSSLESSADDPLRWATSVQRHPRVTGWREMHGLVPGKFDARDYNFTMSSDPVVAGSEATKIDLSAIKSDEIFEYPGGFQDNSAGKSVAVLRLKEREVEHRFVHGVSCYDSLAAASTFRLENPPGQEEGGKASTTRWLLTAVRHRAEQLPEYGLSMVGYGNSFTAIPEAVPFVPPRVTPKPRIHGPQTAIVVGDKETKQGLVDTDEYGRIKVQFHWDRKGKKDKDSSCWIRVAQVHAGASWGAMALPRLGQEVVVSFLDGDPDRPLVTGVVYNALHSPPRSLPAAKHRTVFMTRSFPDGDEECFNELSFVDEKGKEQIYLHAERDFERVVEHADKLTVGKKIEKKKSDEPLEDRPDGSQEIIVVGDQTVTIEKGDQKLTLQEGNREKLLEKGKETLTLKGGREATVDKGDKLKVASGDLGVEVSSGKETHKASTSIELEVSGNKAVINSSGITLTVGGSSIKIEQAGITLSLGGSSVKLEASGVTIKGMTFKAEGSISAEVKGLMTSIKGDAMLTTKGGITMMS